MRYIIGIDLGTTNVCVSYVDTQALVGSELAIHPFKIPQVDRRGMWQKLAMLPSVCYIDAGLEEKSRARWNHLQDYVVGEWAAALGAIEPGKAVISAKSWLCHGGVDRRHRLLPLEAEDEKTKISPVEATSRYLSHIREAWDDEIAKGQPDSFFHEQEIILTIPASFDETARVLTLEAAQKAGLTQLTLLEEPQAAFYAWISQGERESRHLLPKGSLALVCDVGGGTTDFSLIEVTEGEGAVFQRMAVGDHLLLGGDNMDEALVHFLEAEGAFKNLSHSQWMQLRHEVKKAKEVLLSEGGSEEHSIVLQGKGSSVVKGSLKINLSKHDVQNFLLNGFFRSGEWQEFAKPIPKTGLKTFGLPYESEPSIIRQLGAFLGRNLEGGKAPTAILFNGGAMTPPLFQTAVVSAIEKWFPGASIQRLKPYHLDLAVARGAAYLGKAKRGHGIKIGGGSARAFYISIIGKDDKVRALTILPRGAVEGVKYETEEVFTLQLGKPVRFELYSTNVRLKDQFSDIVEIDPDELRALPPLSTVMKQKRGGSESEVKVKLIAELTELGTLSLKLKSLHDGHQWALEFQLKSATKQEDALLEKSQDQSLHSRFDESWLEEGASLVQSYFQKKVEGVLFDELEKLYQMPKIEFPLVLLRRLAEASLKTPPQNQWGDALCARWWNFLGFTLRPGFGFPLDDHRIKEVWKIVLSYNPKSLSQEVALQRCIALRRMAGGFNRGQQNQLASEVLLDVLGKDKSGADLKGKGAAYQYSERLRLVASLERLDQSTKIKIARSTLQRLKSKQSLPVDWWALGRIGARRPLYGSVADVVLPQECVKWVEAILEKKPPLAKEELSCLKSIAAKSERRELNLPADIIKAILIKAEHVEGYPELHRALTECQMRKTNEIEEAFGDHLPIGLSIC